MSCPRAAPFYAMPTRMPTLERLISDAGVIALANARRGGAMPSCKNRHTSRSLHTLVDTSWRGRTTLGKPRGSIER